MKHFRLIFATALVFSAHQIHAQIDTTFHDRNWKVTTRSEAYYYRVKVKNAELYEVKDFSKCGDLEVSGTYTSLDPEMKDGKFTYYRKNGLVSKEGTFANNKEEGKWNYYDTLGRIREIDEYSEGNHLVNEIYYSNGNLKRKERYIDGQLASGNCYSENGEEIAFFPYEENAEFPGGKVALIKYLRDNLIYPPLAYKNRIEGKVYLRFVIDATGKVTDVKVTRAAHQLLDEAAVAVVSSMPDWTPGKIDGKPISSYFDLPINFSRK